MILDVLRETARECRGACKGKPDSSMLKWHLYPMKIAIAADHAGFSLKEALRESCRPHGHEMLDFGSVFERVNRLPGLRVCGGRTWLRAGRSRGILVCSTGIGMSIAANKVAGIRAALASSRGRRPTHARAQRCQCDRSRGAVSVDRMTPNGLVDIFLKTEFAGGGAARAPNRKNRRH